MHSNQLLLQQQPPQQQLLQQQQQPQQYGQINLMQLQQLVAAQAQLNMLQYGFNLPNLGYAPMGPGSQGHGANAYAPANAQYSSTVPYHGNVPQSNFNPMNAYPSMYQANFPQMQVCAKAIPHHVLLHSRV